MAKRRETVEDLLWVQGFTPRTLADKAKVSHQTIYSLQAGTRQPNAGTVMVLAHYLKVGMGRLRKAIEASRLAAAAS